MNAMKAITLTEFKTDFLHFRKQSFLRGAIAQLSEQSSSKHMNTHVLHLFFALPHLLLFFVSISFAVCLMLVVVKLCPHDSG
jgi:hypothetical protein